MPNKPYITLFIVAGVLAVAGCGSKASADKQAGPQAMPVKVMAVQAQMVPTSTDYLATLVSRNSSALQPIVEGYVTRVFVHSGQRGTTYAPRPTNYCYLVYVAPTSLLQDCNNMPKTTHPPYFFTNPSTKGHTPASTWDKKSHAGLILCTEYPSKSSAERAGATEWDVTSAGF